MYPAPGASDYSVELPDWSYCSWFMCVGVSVWLGWSDIRVAGFSRNDHPRLLTPLTSRQTEFH